MGELDLILPSGKGQPLFVETYGSVFGLTAAAPTTNRAQLAWIGRLAKPLRVVNFHAYIGAAAGNIDIGAVTMNGTAVTLLGSTGATATAGANVYQAIAPSATLWLPVGVDLWLVESCSTGTTLTIGRSAVNTSAGSIANRYGFADTQHALGASFTATIGTSFAPWLAVTLSET